MWLQTSCTMFFVLIMRVNVYFFIINLALMITIKYFCLMNVLNRRGGDRAVPWHNILCFLCYNIMHSQRSNTSHDVFNLLE